MSMVKVAESFLKGFAGQYKDGGGNKRWNGRNRGSNNKGMTKTTDGQKSEQAHCDSSAPAKELQPGLEIRPI